MCSFIGQNNFREDRALQSPFKNIPFETGLHTPAVVVVLQGPPQTRREYVALVGRQGDLDQELHRLDGSQGGSD